MPPSNRTRLPPRRSAWSRPRRRRATVVDDEEDQRVPEQIGAPQSGDDLAHAVVEGAHHRRVDLPGLVADADEAGVALVIDHEWRVGRV